MNDDTLRKEMSQAVSQDIKRDIQRKSLWINGFK